MDENKQIQPVAEGGAPQKKEKVKAKERWAGEELNELDEETKRQQAATRKKKTALQAKRDRQLAEWVQTLCPALLSPEEMTRRLTEQRLRLRTENGQEKEISLMEKVKEVLTEEKP